MTDASAVELLATCVANVASCLPFLKRIIHSVSVSVQTERQGCVEQGREGKATETSWFVQKRALHLEDPQFHRVVQLLYLESSKILLDCIFTPEKPTITSGPVVGGVHDALRRLRYHWEGMAKLRMM